MTLMFFLPNEINPHEINHFEPDKVLDGSCMYSLTLSSDISKYLAACALLFGYGGVQMGSDLKTEIVEKS